MDITATGDSLEKMREHWDRVSAKLLAPEQPGRAAEAPAPPTNTINEEDILPAKYYDYEKKPEQKKKGPFANVDKWKLFKHVAAMAASGCASVVVSRYFKANMPESQNVFEKAVTGVGMYFITGIVSTKVSEYVEAELDTFRDGIVKEVADGRED